MHEDLDGMQILNDAQCLSLVRRVRVGHIAITHRAMPLILPVTFGVPDADVIISVGSGVLAEAADQAQVVCLQADWLDDETMASWSVSMIGQITPLVNATEIRFARELNIKPWSNAELRYARLCPEFTTGRARGLRP